MTSELSLRTALEPATLDDATKLAKAACASRLYNIATPEAALMILLTGRDLGLSSSQSMRAIHIVSGKPVISADALVAAVRRSGLCESWRTIESTTERCTIETRRKGEEHPERETFTIEDAKRARLDAKDVWKSYPRDMLRHRCAAGLVRRVYPDVALGCYTPGEIDDPPVHVDVQTRAPSAERPAAPSEDAVTVDAQTPSADAAVSAEIEAERRYQSGPSTPQAPPADGRDPLSTPNAKAFIELLAATNSTDGVVAAWLRFGSSFASEGSDVLRACFAEGVNAYVAYGGLGREEFEADIKRAKESERVSPDTKSRSKSRKSAAAPLARTIDVPTPSEWDAQVSRDTNAGHIAGGFHKRSLLWRERGELARVRAITVDRLCALLSRDESDASAWLDGCDPARRSERRQAETERRPVR